MHRTSVVSVAILVSLALFLGCSKHGKNSTAKKGTEMPMVGKKTTSDTSDIFKEFYSEDTTGQKSSKKSSKKGAGKNETFSPASASASPADFSPNGRYVVQVSCVQSKSFAEKIAGKLKAKNVPAYVAEVQNPTPQLAGTFYRVRAGGFSGLSVAKSFGENSLKPDGYEYWVDKKSNDNVGMEGYGLGGGKTGGAPSSSYETTAPSSSSSWSGSASGSGVSPSSSASGGGTGSSSAGSSVSPAPASAPAASTSPTFSPPEQSASASSEAPPAATPAPATSGSGSTKTGTTDWGTDTSSSSGTSSGGW